MAQWSDDFTQNLAISNLTDTGASLPKVHATDDGKLWVAWLSWEDGMNGYIKAQLLDKEGNALLDEGGIYVSHHVTASWTSDFDMQVTPDGGCVICHSDSRNDTESRQTFEPFCYKLDQEGNFLWGLDGVKLPTTEARGHRPKIGVTRQGSILIGYNDVRGNAMQFQIVKMNDDGTLAWAQPIEVDGSFGVFFPCEDDDLYLSIIAGGSIQLYRMDSLGDWVWDAPIIVESRDPNTRTECVPMSDGQDGVVMSFQRYINLSTIHTCLQRITPDGETAMGLTPIDISEEPGIHSSAGVGVNGEREEMIAYWSWDQGDDEHLMAQKYNYYGDPIWEEPVDLEQFPMFGYACAEGKVLDDGSSILLVGAYRGAVKLDLLAIKLDKDGNQIWKKQIAPQSYLNQPYPIWDEDQAYVFWTDNRVSEGSSPYGTIWGQNIYYETGEGGVSSIKSAEAGKQGFVKAANGEISFSANGGGVLDVYNAAGAKVASCNAADGINTMSVNLPTGIYIVRLSDANGVVTGKITL